MMRGSRTGFTLVETMFVSAISVLALGAVVSFFAGSARMVRTAFAEALVRVSKMTFGDLRAAALEKFSFDLMIARTRRVYEELATVL